MNVLYNWRAVFRFINDRDSGISNGALHVRKEQM
jgi:hypothetical protein